MFESDRIALVGKLKEMVLNSSATVLTTADLDGDSIGSMLGLALLIREVCPRAKVELNLEKNIPSRYAFMFHCDTPVIVADSPPDWSDSFVIILDSDPGRLTTFGHSFSEAKYRGIVDHHQQVALNDYDFVLYDGAMPSTTTLVYALFQASGVTPNLDAASALYAGLVFDTSIFRYKLTSSYSLRMAAELTDIGVDHSSIVEQLLLVQPIERVRLRALAISRMEVRFDGRFVISVLHGPEVGEVDTGGLVDDLVFIDGVEAAALLLVRTDDSIRVSLRSRGALDVSRLAKLLNPSGGGHQRAAGVTMRHGFTKVNRRLNEELARYFVGK